MTAEFATLAEPPPHEPRSRHEDDRRAGPAPGPVGWTPAIVLGLQRSGAGNQAIARALLAGRSLPRATVARTHDAALKYPTPAVGGATLDLKHQNALRVITNELDAATIRRIKKQVLTDRLSGAVTATGQDIPETTQTAVLAAFQTRIDVVPADNSDAAYNATLYDPSLQGLNLAGHLARALFDELVEHFVPAVRADLPALDAQIEARMQRIGEIKPVPGSELRGFTAALCGMPGFGALVSKIESDNKIGGRSASAKTTTQWKGGGSLVDMISEVTGPKEPLIDDDLRDGRFKSKIKEVDAFYKTLVEPDVLGAIEKPKIIAHRCRSYERARSLNAKSKRKVPEGFNSYQADSEVHVGQDAYRKTIAHEVGHHIENNLPRDRWQDIQLFMLARHNAAGGDGTLQDVKLQHGAKPRLAGAYAATGEYTSRVYGDPSTELTAMTAQYLSNADEIATMVDDDPAQAALVVRALRPKEYAQHAALRAYDKYLPPPG